MMHSVKQQNSRSTSFAVIGLLIGLALCSTTARAQGTPKGNLTPHSATITFTPGAGSTGTNAYKCIGSCTATTGTFALLNTTPLPLTQTTITDLAVTPLEVVNYCLTGVLQGGTGTTTQESACSPIVTGTVPKDAVSPPGVPSLAVQ